MRYRLTALCLTCLLAAVRVGTGQQLQPPATQLPPAPAGAGPGDAPPDAQPVDPNTPLVKLLNAIAGKYELQGNRLHFVTSVELQPPNSPTKFFADDVVVYLDENRLEARGNVVFAEPDGRIAAERVEFDLGKGTGTFYDASGIMAMGKFANQRQFAGQEPDVYFYGEKIEKLPDRKYRITKGAFTTCVQPTPRWELTSGSVNITLDDYAFARGTVLRVKGMPLLYLPVMYYPLQESQRATGFLLPTYGTSTYRGQAISNGFFWAIDRSRDLTLMHDWFTRSGQGGGAEYRYIENGQSSGNVKVYRFARKQTEYDSNGATVSLPANTSIDVQSAVNHRITQQLRARARVDYFSDILTQQLYHQDIYQATRSTRVIDGSLSGTFGLMSASAQYSRNEYLTGTTSSSVYGSTPRLAASIAPQMLFGTPIYASANTEYAFIPNRQLGDVNGHREVLSDTSLGKWDVAPSLRVPLSRLTYLSANTSASYRSTFYSRSKDAEGDLTSESLLRQFLTVRTEVIGPVLTKIWDTPESQRTERMKHVIEPTFAVDYTTEFANQSLVPNTNDAADVIVGGAARVTYGVTNRLFYRGRPTENAKGLTREFVTVGVQQSYYTDPLASRYDTSYVSYSGRAKSVALSPVAVTARFSPTNSFDTNTRVEYDVNGDGLQVFSAGASMNSLKASGNVTFSRNRPTRLSDTSSFLTGSTGLRLRDGRVTSQYVISWDIARGYVVNQTVATSYMAQCCGVQFEFQNFNYQPTTTSYGIIPADRRFNISLVLAGLGSISNFFGAFGGTGTVR
ncbi:MAG TPA: putative LPS assembly protein LptD [Vicinamibacterales bacterium]|jgi:lipopolysaccharide assembly outer membrane protein LptD (OstA)|nr:putative LPS assembly protein LptD [Vicinamibacterales bacterium]